MIVPMKKAAIIVQSKDAEGAVETLRSLGVIHVEHENPPKGKDIAELHEDAALADEAIGILSAGGAGRKGLASKKETLSDWKHSARHIVDLRKHLEQLDEYASTITNSISLWERWGDFDPEKIKFLAAKNIFIRLYRIPAKEMKAVPEGVIVKRIGVPAGGIVDCAIISRGAVEIPFKELTLPRLGSLEKMRSRLKENLKAMESIRQEIQRSFAYQDVFIRVKEVIRKELEFREALSGMGRAGEIAYLTGYIPQDEVEKFLKAAGDERWGAVIRDPSDDDNVPTLVRNPRWVSVIEPVFRLMEIVPGYREMDISPAFLIFLTLFFGMIIGDAGYGLLYIALTAFAQKKLGEKIKNKRIFFLLYIFSASAVMWGLLTGTVFGQEWYLARGMRPGLPVLNNTRFLQALCFFIGALHLTLGQLWQGMRKLPSLAAVADIGWALVLWAAFFLARMLILGYPLPGIAKWLIIAGVTLVVVFTNPQKNILKAVGSGLGSLALSIMNNFTDVVSYVRLFAVGLAGVAISDTVNSLAASFGGNSPIVPIFILFIGHTINIVLGPISVMVHGVRLNVLEFSGHAGLSWSGTAYKPLKNR